MARSFDSLLTYYQLRIIIGKKNRERKRKCEKKIRCETVLVRFTSNNKVRRRQHRLQNITENKNNILPKPENRFI
jgi:ribosomal protein L20A (L18A)